MKTSLSPVPRRFWLPALPVVFLCWLPPTLEAVETPCRFVGLNAELGVFTIYNFRGINAFQEDGQRDQAPFFAPSLTWTVADTGFWIKYWAAYQLGGDNRQDLIDAGVGHEQDLIIGFSQPLIPDKLALTSCLAYYFYPFASPSTAGVSNPSYIEPSVCATLSHGADFSLGAAYFYGVQSSLEAYRYVYLTSTIGKTFSIASAVATTVSGTFGYKHWNLPSQRAQNVYDAAAAWTWRFALGPRWYVTPGLNGAWTNLDEKTPADEYMIFGSLATGVNL